MGRCRPGRLRRVGCVCSPADVDRDSCARALARRAHLRMCHHRHGTTPALSGVRGPKRSQMTVGVTGLVVTRNAGQTLDVSLRSLAPWVDELLVVDMASEDDTKDIARRHGARILDHEPVGYADPARGFGVDAAAHDWIMMLDADEVIPRPLSRRLREI